MTSYKNILTVTVILFSLSAFSTSFAAPGVAPDSAKHADAIADAPNRNAVAPNIMYRHQGYTMRLTLDNRGALGKTTYPQTTPPAESLGLEYPVGQRIEHLFGGGIWVGALLDTSTVTPPSRIKAVSTSYEGYGGGITPLYEFYPGSSLQDSIWRINGKDTLNKPANWDSYWGASLPFRPISDNDFYCTYTDTGRTDISPHTPMRLKIIQSSYTWNDPYAEAFTIVEYKIINQGRRDLDSAYIGIFADCDVGPISVPNYQNNNFTGYDSVSHTAYIHNPVNRGSTPVGVTLLYTTGRNLSDLRYGFNWYPLLNSPNPDAAKYNLMSSGIILGNEYPQLSDTRFLFSFGPFNIKPTNGNFGTPDTLKVAIAIVSGFSQTIDPRINMLTNAGRALNVYLNQGLVLPPTPPSPPLRTEIGFRRVKLDWEWRQGDYELFGRWNPEANWDTTNQIARLDPHRYLPPHPIGMQPGIDTTKGGRNFESFRIWRSENPFYPTESFTLIRQVDVDWDNYSYNTGIEYTFEDSNLVRGKTYVYSVTSVSIPNIAVLSDPNGGLDTVEVEPLESGLRVNAVRIDLPFAASQELGKVSVVPNPYRTDRDYTLESGGYEGLTSGWNENLRVIKFINLPAKCKIRIFSLSGDLVKEVDHDGTTEAYPRGDHSVTLLSDSNRALASGIYIFTVESGLGTQTGKFVIIR